MTCLAHYDSAAEEPPVSAPVSELSSTLSTSLSSTPAPTVKITGSLLERGTKRPLSQVNIYCFPASLPETPIKSTTDTAGAFIDLSPRRQA